jgi:hypothetical protein
MKFGKVNNLTRFLTSGALSVAVSCGTTLAATPAQISVTGLSRGYTNADVRGLIARGVEAALAEGGTAPTSWLFSVQSAAGNRPQTQIVATLHFGNARQVSGFFTSPNLGTAPTSVFVEEVREFAKRLLRRADA